MYQIHWWNPDTNARGNGQPVSAAIAEAWLRVLKNSHPEMEHYMVPVDPRG